MRYFVLSILLLLAFVFSSGCLLLLPEPLSVSILSVETGKQVEIKKQSNRGSMRILAMDKKNRLFYLITTNENKTCNYIMAYNMSGEKIKEYQLPFYTASWLAYPPFCERAYIPSMQRFIYTEEIDKNNNELRYYDVASNKAGKFTTIKGSIANIYVVNDTFLLIKVKDGGAGFLYTLDIKNGELKATLDIPIFAELRVNPNDSSVAIFSSSQILLYDVETLTLRNHITVADKSYFADGDFSPNGKQFIWEELSKSTTTVRLSRLEHDSWSIPEIVFELPEKATLTNGQFYSNQVYLYAMSDWRLLFTTDLLYLYDLSERKVIKRFSIPTYNNWLQVLGDYIIWEN